MSPFSFLAGLTSNAEASGASRAASPDLISGLIVPALLILALFYFMFILPQRKQQKQHDELIKALKKGDEVVTSGGIFGVISGFNEHENTVYIKLGENAKIELQRNSIAGLRKKSVPVQQNVESKK